MKIDISEKGQASVITVSGRIDGSTVTQFDSPINELIKKGKTRIVLDMNGVEYMSSIGIRTIISAMKTLKTSNGSLRLANISKYVHSILLMVDIAMFEVYDTVDQAVSA